MMRHGGRSGGGLLGEAPISDQGSGNVSMGMKRLMGHSATGAGGGEGLLGRAPNAAGRMQQQQQQQAGNAQRLQAKPAASAWGGQPSAQQHNQQQDIHRGYQHQQHQQQASGARLLEDPGYYEEQEYNQQPEYQQYREDPYMEQEQYQEETYVEETYAEPQYAEQDYRQDYVEPETYPTQEQYPQEHYSQDSYTQEEYYEEPISAGSLMEYAEQRHGLKQRKETRRDQLEAAQLRQAGRDRGRDPNNKSSQGRNQPGRNQSGQNRSPAGLAARSQLDQGRNQGRNQAAQGRNQQGQGRNQAAQGRNKQRSPVRNKGVKGFGNISPNQQRGRRVGAGLLDTPEILARGMLENHAGQGLLDNPDIMMGNPINMAVEREATNQLDLMNKAELQMRLLEEEKLRERREMEQFTLLQQQQQAILLQQQQAMRQIQQQQQLLQQQQEMRPPPIPSIFDITSTSRPSTNAKRTRKTGFGLKRPGSTLKAGDVKRSRFGYANRTNRLSGNRDAINRRHSRGSKQQERKSRFSSASPKRSLSNPRSRDTSRRDTDRRRSGSSGAHNSRDRRSSKDKTTDRRKSEGIAGKPDARKKESKVEEYDPANPTEDVIDVPKKEGAAVSQSTMEITSDIKEENSAEVKGEEKKDPEQEISLTVTVNKKGRSVNDKDKPEGNKEPKKKNYRCNVCSVECYDESSFGRHMNGIKHQTKMRLVMMNSTNRRDIMKSRIVAEEHLRQIEAGRRGRNQPAKKPVVSSCKVCDSKFTGSYKDHKEVPEHKNKLKLQTEEGKEEEDIADLVTLDTVGYEDDANSQTETTSSSSKSHPEKVTPSDSTQSDDEDLEIPEKYDHKVVVGQKFVVPVYGFFCKICRKFYNNENTAKVTHCQSQPHYDRYKKLAKAKLAKKKREAAKANKSTEKAPEPKVKNGDSQDEPIVIDEACESSMVSGKQDTTTEKTVEKSKTEEVAEESEVAETDQKTTEKQEHKDEKEMAEESKEETADENKEKVEMEEIAEENDKEKIEAENIAEENEGKTENEEQAEPMEEGEEKSNDDSLTANSGESSETDKDGKENADDEVEESDKAEDTNEDEADKADDTEIIITVTKGSMGSPLKTSVPKARRGGGTPFRGQKARRSKRN